MVHDPPEPAKIAGCRGYRHRQPSKSYVSRTTERPCGFTQRRKIAPIFFPSKELADRMVSVSSTIAHTPSALAT